MTKSKALQLRPGDWVSFGPSAYSIDAERYGTKAGEVIHVTPKGGILVLVTQRTDGDLFYPITPHEKWVPYHHVITAKKLAPRARARKQLRLLQEAQRAIDNAAA